jgi:predicted nucleotidyltransferase
MKPNVPLKDLITNLCKEIEKEEKVKILFAVENGSRAWRMDSANSDYDVRFVYHYPYEKYLSLNPPKDVLEKYYDEKGKKHPKDDCYIDAVGFDVYKFLKLLSHSNPTTIEWLKSDIVYYGKQDKEFQRFAFNHFKKITLFYHYKSLARQNYEKYIASGKLVTYKKYLYVFRGMVNADYVEEFNKVPPIELAEAVKETDMPEQIKGAIINIIEMKKLGKEKEEIKRIDFLDTYIEKFLAKEMVPPKKGDKKLEDILEKELLKILLKKRR